MVKKVEFKVGKETVRGSIFEPEGDGPFPGVVCFHGSLSNRQRSLPVGEALSSKGFIVLAIDFRGHGESDGDIKKLSFKDFIVDGKEAVKLLVDKGADPKRIGLRGGSMGGFVAACLSNSTNAKSLVLLVPAAFPNENFTIEKSRSMGSEYLNNKESWINSIALREIANFNGSLLVIRHELDELLSKEMTEAFYYEANATRDRQLDVVNGAKHSSHDNPEAIKKDLDLTLSWFLKTI